MSKTAKSVSETASANTGVGLTGAGVNRVRRLRWCNVARIHRMGKHWGCKKLQITEARCRSSKRQTPIRQATQGIKHALTLAGASTHFKAAGG